MEIVVNANPDRNPQASFVLSPGDAADVVIAAIKAVRARRSGPTGKAQIERPSQSIIRLVFPDGVDPGDVRRLVEDIEGEIRSM